MTYPVKLPIVRKPTHPGEILREDVLPALGMSVRAAADELGVTRQTLYRLISGKAAVTPDMAIRIGKFCGNGPDAWLRMQVNYDLWHAARRMKAVAAKIRTHRVREPIAANG